MLDQVVGAEETLKEKERLKDMWPIVHQVLAELKANTMDLDGAANLILHCKVYTMCDKSFAELVFVLPHLVQCHGRATTWGSVASRLLRSMRYERKIRVAPPSFLERQIKEALEQRTRKQLVWKTHLNDGPHGSCAQNARAQRRTLEYYSEQEC